MTKYTKISVSILSAVVFSYAVIISPVFAIDTTDNDSSAAVAPSTQDNGDSSGLSTSDNGDSSGAGVVDNGDSSGLSTTDNGDSSGLSTSDNGDSSGTGVVDNGDSSGLSTSDNGDSSGTGSVDNGNSSGSGSESSGGSSGGGRSNRSTSKANESTILPIISDMGDCSYLTAYMKFGAINDSAEVTKLQKFLKNMEELDVDVNGEFDQKTLDAVKAFQAKYLADVMGPWGSKNPTGQVYFTTKKKIDEIVCKANFSLTAGQLAQIAAYRNGVANGTITTDSEGNIISTSTNATSTEVGTNGTDGSQVAGAAGTSFFSKIWSFIKWIFGY